MGRHLPLSQALQRRCGVLPLVWVDPDHHHDNGPPVFLDD